MIEAAKSAEERAGLIAGLITIADRLTPAKREKAIALAADALLTGIKGEKGRAERNLFVELAAALPPKHAATLFAAATQRAVGEDRRGTGEWLAITAGRLPAAEAASLCRPVAESLVTALAKAEDYSSRRELAESLAVIAERLPPDAVTEVCLPAVELLAKKDEISGMLALARVLPAGETAKACRPVAKLWLDKLKQSTLPGEQAAHAHTLVRLLACLPADETESYATVAADVFLAALVPTKPDIFGMNSSLPGPLHNDREELIRRLSNPMLARELKVRNPLHVTFRGEPPAGLAAAVCFMKSDKATEIFRRVAGLLSDGKSGFKGKDRIRVAKVLEEMAMLLPTSTKGNASAADAFASAIKQVESADELVVLSTALYFVAQHLEPTEREDHLVSVIDRLTDSLSWDGGNSHAIRSRILSLSVLLPPSKSAANISRLLKRPSFLDQLVLIADQLAAAAERLSGDEAQSVIQLAAETLATAVVDAKESTQREVMARALAVLAQRLPAQKAQKVLGPAVKALTAAVANAAFAKQQEPLVRGLAKLAAVTPTADTNEVRAATTDTLFDTIGNADDDYARWELTNHLEAVVLGVAVDQLPRMKAVPVLVGGTAHVDDRVPKPRPLPPQQLVELLKHPFCVKEARRAVLDALDFTYDRKFGDLWEFVAFAEKEHPELDLLTPPKRPEKVVPKSEKK